MPGSNPSGATTLPGAAGRPRSAVGSTAVVGAGELLGIVAPPRGDAGGGSGGALAALLLPPLPGGGAEKVALGTGAEAVLPPGLSDGATVVGDEGLGRSGAGTWGRGLTGGTGAETELRPPSAKAWVNGAIAPLMPSAAANVKPKSFRRSRTTSPYRLVISTNIRRETSAHIPQRVDVTHDVCVPTLGSVASMHESLARVYTTAIKMVDVSVGVAISGKYLPFRHRAGDAPYWTVAPKGLGRRMAERWRLIAKLANDS